MSNPDSEAVAKTAMKTFPPPKEISSGAHVGSLDQYREIHEAFEADVLEIDLDSALAARSAPGGTAPDAVAAQHAAARERLATERERSS